MTRYYQEHKSKWKSTYVPVEYDHRQDNGGRPPAHGHTGRVNGKAWASPTYISWRSMKARCLYPSMNKYEIYGGRGIKVCDRWMVFENFLEDMGERPLGKSLDRIDPNGDYVAGNVRWATAKEQRNNRRDTHIRV